MTSSNPYDLLDISSTHIANQQTLMKVAMQNLQNKDSRNPDGTPYRREFAMMAAEYDKNVGAVVATLKRFDKDTSPLQETFDPSHPAANPATGMVQMSNINPFLEMVDAKEAYMSVQEGIKMYELGSKVIGKYLKLMEAPAA